MLPIHFCHMQLETLVPDKMLVGFSEVPAVAEVLGEDAGQLREILGLGLELVGMLGRLAGHQAVAVGGLLEAKN